MHRAYRPIQPAQNKLLQRRWDDKYYEDHRRKVIEARPTVDSRPPQTYMHLHLKLKKLQLEEDRLSTIERDNRILLGKMSTIMKAKGGVDNRNSYEQRSLNREKRVRELLRVGNENQQILTRITTRRPQYDHAEWEKDWETNQRYMDNISSYPKDWWKKGEDYSDGSPRSNRGGGATNRTSRTNDDSRDSSPRQQDKSRKKKSEKRRDDDEDEDEDDGSYSEDEENKRQSRRREENKKKGGKKREEEEEDDDDEEEDRDRRKGEDRKRAGNRSERDKYVDAGKQDSKRKGK